MTQSPTWGYDHIFGDLVIWTVGGPLPGPPGREGGGAADPLCCPGRGFFLLFWLSLDLRRPRPAL